MITYRLLVLLGQAGLVAAGFVLFAAGALAVGPMFIGARLGRPHGRLAEATGAAYGLAATLALALWLLA